MVKPYASSLQSIDPWSYKLVGPTRQDSLHRTNDLALKRYVHLPSSSNCLGSPCSLHHQSLRFPRQHVHGFWQ